MIKKFNEFINELVTSTDMQNNLNLNIEKGDAQNPAKSQQNQQQDKGLQKSLNLKVTDIQGRITELGKQKQLCSQEIVNLQNSLRDLMPNNPGDPNNAKNQQDFTKQQQEKINIQKQKLDVLNKEILNLQGEITRNKNKYQ
jgi:hypothetical protein